MDNLLSYALPPAYPGTGRTKDALLAAARKAFEADDYGRARALCRQLHALDPESGDAHFVLGLIAYNERDGEEAAAHFGAAVRAAPSAPRHSYLADALRLQGLMDPARRAARMAIAIEPSLPMPWASLGAGFGATGQGQQGVAALSRARLLDERARAMVPRGLAACLLQLGRADEAEAVCREALMADILDPLSHITMTEILLAQERIEEALCEAALASRLGPRFADTHAILARALAAAGRSQEALAAAETALGIDPDQSPSWVLKAEILIDLHRPAEALAAAERALSAAASDDLAGIHMLRAEALESLRRGNEALAAYESVLSAGAEAPMAEVRRTQLLLELGQLDDASGLSCLNGIESRFPGFLPAIVSRADLKKFTARDPDIGRMETELRRPRLKPAAEANLRFALGKAYLDLKDGATAFDHLDKANRLRRAAIDYDPRAADAMVDRLIDRYSAEPGSRPDLPPCGGPIPVFIVGMPRSGTSLTEQILASHPDITGAGELDMMARIEKMAGEAGLWSQSAIDLAEFTRLGQHYRDHLATLSGGRRYVVDKMPGNYRNIGLIRRLLPEARIIHCRRDPLDTCVSCYSKSFHDELKFTFDQSELGRYYRGYLRLMGHWRSLLPADAWIEIDYEDTVADIESQTRKLLDHIGLPWNDACLSFHKTQRQVKTASTRQVRRPLYNTSVHVSRHYEEYLQPLIRALKGEPDPALTFSLRTG